MSKKVSFDFDGTLSRTDVQDYAKQLMRLGVDVWVVTSRYDENQKHRYPKNATNEDLWQVVDALGLPRYKVRFTCMEEKCLYLEHTHFLWHLDDDVEEIASMIAISCKTVGIYVKSDGWKSFCNKLLTEDELKINN